MPLQFVRYSNTRRVPQNAVAGPFGSEGVWTHNYQWLMRDAGTEESWGEKTIGDVTYLSAHYPLIRVTFPDGSDYSYMSSVSVEDEDAAIADGKFPPPAIWSSAQGADSTLVQNGDLFELHLADSSIIRFLNINPRIKPLPSGSGYKRVESRGMYRLVGLEDAEGNHYGFEEEGIGTDFSQVRKVTDQSGRYLQFTYSNLFGHTARSSQTYSTVLRDHVTLGQWHEITFLNPQKAARFLTLIVKNRDPAAPAMKVAELEFYDEEDNLITGTAFGAEPLASSGDVPANAFDGDINTYYEHAVSTAGYVGIDCGSKKVSRIRYFIPGCAGTKAEFELAGITQMAAPNRAITQVTSSDGRSVSYTYSTVSDATGWFNWHVLDGVHYSDGTHAAYTYQQTAAFSRPLMTHCADPRIQGNGTQISYTYDSAGALGFLKEERSGVTGDLIAGTAHDGPHEPKAIYPNGKIAEYGYSAATGRITSHTDGLGNTTTYAHDVYGFLTSVTDPLGRITSYTNNAIGKPITITYPDGTVSTQAYDYRMRLLSSSLSGSGFTTRTTTYTRDTSGRVTQITHPDTTTEHWTYNTHGLPITHTRRNGEVESYTYDSARRLSTSTDAAGKVTSYTYNALDLVATITDPLGRVQSFLYNDHGQVTRQTFADGSFVEFDYDDFGNLITQVNELGQFWATTYDEFRNPLTKTDPLSRTTTYSYGENSPSACGACRASGKPSAITRPGGRTVRFTYDLEWNLLSETDAFGTAHAATTSYLYDAVGNAIQITDPSGSITARAHDGRDRVISVTDALGRTTLTAYDRAGNVISETRPDNGVTLHTYDKMSRRLTTQDAKNQTTTFTYDAEGNLASLTDARMKTYSWVHNATGQTTRKNYPDGSYEAWTFDDARQRLTARTRSGAIATSTFDLRGRETAVNWSDATPDITRSFDAAGRLLTSSNGLSTSSYTYDIAGQQLTETQHLHGIAPTLPAYTISYTWDLDGRNDTVTYPGGTVVSRTYTPRGQVETISEGEPPPLVSYGYNPAGTRANKSLENGTVTTYSYDAAHQMTALSHHHGSAFQTRAYLYNSVGSRSAMQVDGGTWDVYGFDAVDQITSVKYQAASSSGSTPQSTTTYDWDPVGNRELVQTTPASGPIVTDTYGTANAVNQYAAINGQSTSYDTNGNLTAARLQDATNGFVSTLDYDSQNRLLSVQDNTHNVTSTYDTRNRVTSRTINGVTTLFLWDGWDLIEERDLSGNQTRRYVHGAAVDEILIMVHGAGAKYYHHDALGSVTALTDSVGFLIETYQYDVFGKPRILSPSGTTQSASSVDNRFLYTGREWIAEASLYDYRNRVYSPVIGRFMQIDPIRFSAGDVNMYRYVGNNSLIRTDPSGKIGTLISGVIGAAIGGIAGGISGGWKGAAAGAVGGFVGGVTLNPALGAAAAAGLTGATAGVAAGAASGALGGLSGAVVNETIEAFDDEEGNASLSDLVEPTLWGGATGGVLGPVGSKIGKLGDDVIDGTSQACSINAEVLNGILAGDVNILTNAAYSGGSGSSN